MLSVSLCGFKQKDRKIKIKEFIMNYDKACEWFDEVDSERIAELVYEIVHDRHSTDSDKTEYLSNLVRALALHASIH